MSSPATGQSAMTAAHFGLSVIHKGHGIHRVFFLDQGTANGSALAVYPQDEADRLEPWLELAEKHQVELVLCISSALRQGVLDADEAERYEKSAATIHPAFTISGLGQLVDAAMVSDRVVTFGG